MAFVKVKENEEDKEFRLVPLNNNRLPVFNFPFYDTKLYYGLGKHIIAVEKLLGDADLPQPFFVEPPCGWQNTVFFVKFRNPHPFHSQVIFFEEKLESAVYLTFVETNFVKVTEYEGGERYVLLPLRNNQVSISYLEDLCRSLRLYYRLDGYVALVEISGGQEIIQKRSLVEPPCGWQNTVFFVKVAENPSHPFSSQKMSLEKKLESALNLSSVEAGFVKVKEYEDNERFFLVPLRNNRLPRIFLDGLSKNMRLFYRVGERIVSVLYSRRDEVTPEPFWKEPPCGWHNTIFFTRHESMDPPSRNRIGRNRTSRPLYDPYDSDCGCERCRGPPQDPSKPRPKSCIIALKAYIDSLLR